MSCIKFMEKINPLNPVYSTENPVPYTDTCNHMLYQELGICLLNCLADKDLTILWANAPFYKNTGCSEEEFSAKYPGLKQYYHKFAEDYAFIIKKLFRDEDNGGNNRRFVCRMPVKNRDPLWIHISAVSHCTEDGKIPSFFMVITDIDKEYRRQEKKSQYFELLMDEYTGNIYISDMDTYELLYVNKVTCTTLKSDKNDLLGRKCYEVIQGKSSPCDFCTNACLQYDKFYEWEFYNPTLKQTFLIKDRMIDWNGRRARIELCCDTLSTEYKLAKKDQERETLVKTIPGVFCRIDARDLQKILWYGTGFLELIQQTKEDFEENLHSGSSYISREELNHIKDTMMQLKETGQSAVKEVTISLPDGSRKVLTVTYSYISGEDSWDGIPSIYSVAIDITKDRMEQERQRIALEDAYQSLKVANSAKTDFLSSMSHDIRTPMNAIIGMSAIAEAHLGSPEKVGDCLKKINVASRHLLSLINEVLDMSKIESGRIDLTPQSIDLSELIENTSDMFRSLMEEKNQKFHVIVGQVRHEKIIADGDRLRQIFTNLLSNAMKYTQDGGNITMVINELPSIVPEKGWYEFIIIDDGYGIAEDYIPHIFEPFTRAEDAVIRRTQGTGLGMAITENIVHMMNGTIKVKSRLGEGTQFTVSLPLQLQAAEDENAAELLGLPVLVVDDEPAICESASIMLTELGMRGYCVTSGDEAVRRVVEARKRADDFFAVILDWQMPDMDGLTTLKAIRRQVDENIPIIIISAYDYVEIEEEFIRAGADAFITKPLFKSKLLHILKSFCSKNRTAAETKPCFKAHTLSGKRILLAEDNEMNRQIAVELLQMRGITVETAENGLLASEMFLQSPSGYYDAILMDIQMPVMDGYDSTAKIRSMAREDALNTPIIALTANAFVSDIVKAQSVGMNDHVSKPVDISRLVSVLEKWIDH